MAVLVAVACTSASQRDIERAAKGYLEAAGDYRLDDAMPYASRTTREVVLPFYKKVLSRTDTAYVQSNRPADITILSSHMLTDTTAHVYYHKHTPIMDIDDSVLVILEDGKWLVHVDIVIPALMTLDSNSVHRRFNKVLPQTLDDKRSRNKSPLTKDRI